MRATLGVDGDFAQTLRALLGGWVGRSIPLLGISDQHVHWLHDEEEYGRRDENEGDECVHEVAIHEFAIVQGKDKAAEVRDIDDRRDKRGQEVGDKRRYDCAEGRADYNADRKINDIPTK